jgi:hypothetical protein
MISEFDIEASGGLEHIEGSNVGSPVLIPSLEDLISPRAARFLDAISKLDNSLIRISYSPGG